MKCLSLTQPWASLVACGAKRYETRSWATAYRGPIAIHASAGFPGECRELLEESPFSSALGLSLEPGRETMRRLGRGEILPLGMVIAVAQLVEVYEMLEGAMLSGYTRARATRTGEQLPLYLSADEVTFGDFTRGRFAWHLDDTRRIEPTPAKGSLGLWEWTPGAPTQWVYR